MHANWAQLFKESFFTCRSYVQNKVYKDGTARLPLISCPWCAVQCSAVRECIHKQARKSMLLFLLFGVALAFPNPGPDPVSKTTSQHSAHVPPTLTTPLGDVKGALLISRAGRTIYAFRGLRYAKAPINELRFQPPAAVEKWDGVYNATQDGASCPQPDFNPVSEDCLFVNVYTTKLPKTNDQVKRPVIVYFHAGGFYSVSGQSSVEGPQYLLDQDIVLVVPNYRLGSLGFLSTGDKEAPGNNGLKDQVQVLKWVKDNILAFGGDPDSVTILGYSAGGASITLHLVSPLSKGLFHRAIAMSGSSMGNMPISTNQLDMAKKQARLVHCPDDTASNIVKCLKTKPAEELGNSLPGFNEFGSDPVWKWLPVIEPDVGQPRFLTAHPVELVLSGHFEKVPVILGITADEFGGRAYNVILNESLLNELDANFEKVAPIAFGYERDTDHSKAVSKGLRSFYFSDAKIDNSTLPTLAQLYSDGLIGFGVNRAAKILAEKNTEPVYYYRFNYKGRYSHFYLPDSNNTVPYGASHHDDLIYLFYISTLFPEFKDSDPETVTVDKLTTMWANFARTGNPTPEAVDKLDDAKWEPFTTKNQKYLDIGNKLVLGENLYEKRYLEWEKLYPLSKYQGTKHG